MNLLNLLMNVAPNQEVTKGINFTTENLGTAISFMIRGMGGIFFGLFIIYLASVALQKLFPAEENKD